jgi:tRNA (guanine37-N1)-methyltransferase
MMSPDGTSFTQEKAKKYSQKNHLIILCGRYEGFDARIEKLVDEKISVGNYVLSGGELPAMTIADAVTRLIPGVLGNEESLVSETHEDGVTDYPQFTRPDEYKGVAVPEVLKNGHHAEIAKWRRDKQKQITD